MRAQVRVGEAAGRFPVRAHVGARLREIRESRGWSLTDAGAVVGVRRGTLRSWEVGSREPSLDVLGQVAAAYGVALADLLPPGPVEGGQLDLRAALARLRVLVDQADPLPVGGGPDA